MANDAGRAVRGGEGLVPQAVDAGDHRPRPRPHPEHHLLVGETTCLIPTDASPTGDPHIAQSEQAEIDAQRAAKAARLFDIRRLIGGLFLIYGVILVVLGLGESDASIAKSADLNVNLYSGLGMLDAERRASSRGRSCARWADDKDA